MTLEQFSYIGEMVGGIGVILSLLYVGIQLKQTNAMSRSSVRQAFCTMQMDWAMSVATTPSLAEGITKVFFQDLVREEATELERIQISNYFVGLLSTLSLVYENWKLGILTEKELQGLYGSSTAIFSKPYFVSLWPMLRELYPEDFTNWFAQKYKLPVSLTEETGAG